VLDPDYPINGSEIIKVGNRKSALIHCRWLRVGGPTKCDAARSGLAQVAEWALSTDCTTPACTRLSANASDSSPLCSLFSLTPYHACDIVLLTKQNTSSPA